MFIKKLISNYNAFSNALRLIFALNAWVALILIMELIVLLLLAKKQNMTSVATPLWPSVKRKLTLPKLETWSPPGLPKT
jgi:hypothetical protein